MIKCNIAGLQIDCFNSIDSAVDYILDFGVSKTAIAINPEKIILSIDDHVIRQSIVDADIRFLDGYGTVYVAKQKICSDIPRIPGCELWERLMMKSVKSNKSVFLIGSTEDVITKTKEKLENDFNTLVCGHQNGFFNNDEKIIKRLLLVKPDIISVAMGSPRQEIFMSKCRQSGVTAFMMGVGGTYDVFTGNVQRAPLLFRKLRLEWFYRLCSQPTRFKRQFNLLKFLYLALLRKL
jgi:UDP-N-acetyl-D-mannosaminouronate:lipid I N-acetyl-D-mannosaminouronosyltransferase